MLRGAFRVCKFNGFFFLCNPHFFSMKRKWDYVYDLMRTDPDLLTTCLETLTTPEIVETRAKRILSSRSSIVDPVMRLIAQYLEPKEFARLLVTNRKNSALHLTSYSPMLTSTFTITVLLRLRGHLPLSHVELSFANLNGNSCLYVINQMAYIPDSVTSLVLHHWNFIEVIKIPLSVVSLSIVSSSRCFLHWIEYQRVQRLMLRCSSLIGNFEGTFSCSFPHLKVLEIQDVCPWQKVNMIHRLRMPKLEHIIWKVRDQSQCPYLFELLQQSEVPQLTWVFTGVWTEPYRPSAWFFSNLLFLKRVIIQTEDDLPTHRCVKNGVEFEYSDSTQILLGYFPGAK